MYVRLLKHRRGYKPGQILCAADGFCNMLIRRRLAEAVEASDEVKQSAAKGPPAPRRKRK